MKLLILSLLSMVSVASWAQELIHNESTITVQAGAVLYVEGELLNTTTGIINNAGTIELKGNFTNQGNASWVNTGTNTLKFSGGANSTVTSGLPANQFNTVVLQKDATFNVTLADNMTVTNNLDFNATNFGKLITGNFDVKLGTTATVTGYDSDEFISTTGTGGVQKAVAANGTFLFPVGESTNYTPLNNVYTGTAYTGTAFIRTRVNPVVHPNKPTDAESFITRYWDVDQTGITTYGNTLTGTYVAADVNGTATLIKGAVYNGTTWSYVGSTNSGSTVTAITSAANSDFTGTNFYGKPQVKTFLRGAYVDGTNAMTTTLNTNAIIPLTSPYVDAPATVASIPANVTDWIKLELRDPASPSTVLGNASVFIKNDGNIVGLDGTSIPLVKNGKPTSIVNVIHRSHLAVRTPDVGINVVNPSSVWNFSADTLNAYRNPAILTNANMMFMPLDSKYVMWGGNANGNANVRYTTGTGDEAYLLGTVLGGNTATIISGAASYTSGADMNMNGVIKYTTGSGDEAFLLGTMLLGNTAKIITQHQ